MENLKRFKLVRVVTQAEVVQWHLHNFIIRAVNDYALYIVGDGVTKYQKDYPEVVFIDLKICRKVELWNDLKALLSLIRLFVNIKPTIVHSIMPKSGLLSAIAAKLSFVPIRLHTYTGQVWSTQTGRKRNFYRFLDKIIFKLNTKCLTDSFSQSNFLAENGFVKNGKAIEYLGKGSLTGVELKQYDISLVADRDVLRGQLGMASNDFVFGFYARKSISKGIKYVFESFSKVEHLDNVKLIMVGADETGGVLDSLFEEYQSIKHKIINIEVGHPHEVYLAVCDVLCSPSSSEGFGSIVVEAAAMGIPTIGFRVLGLTDSVEDTKTGVLVPYGDASAFAQAMLNLYQDVDLFHQMRNDARERILKYFSADEIYKLQKQFYNSLLK